MPERILTYLSGELNVAWPTPGPRKDIERFDAVIKAMQIINDRNGCGWFQSPGGVSV